MMRRTLLALALLAAPAVVMAQQPSPMQGQAPAADTSKAKAKSSQKSSSSHKSSKKHESKPATKPAAKPATKDTAKTKP